MKLGILELIDTKGMSENDIKTLETLDEAIGAAFQKSFESYLKDEIKLEEFHKSVDKTLSELKEKSEKFVSTDAFEKKMAELEKFAVSIKAASEKAADGSVRLKTIEEQLYEQFGEYAYKDNNGAMRIKADEMKEGRVTKTIKLVYSTKASTDPITTANGSPVAGGITIDNVISVTPRKNFVLRDVANTSPISTVAVTYAELTNVEGDASWVPEGGLKPSMSGDVTTKTVTVGKVALTAKITTEVMSDIPQLVQEIRNEIINKIDAKEEDGILNGTGSSGQIKGVKDDMPGFTLDGISVQSPNYYDALVAAYTQITSSSNMAYSPNAVLMHPVDYANMQSAKATDGQYLRPFKIGDELISNLRVIPDSNIEVGKFIMGDFNYLNIRDYQELTISFGWENQDFTKNLVTMLGEKRLLAYIKSNHKTAFVADEFATVITAITPSAD